MMKIILFFAGIISAQLSYTYDLILKNPTQYRGLYVAMQKDGRSDDDLQLLLPQKSHAIPNIHTLDSIAIMIYTTLALILEYPNMPIGLILDSESTRSVVAQAQKLSQVNQKDVTLLLLQDKDNFFIKIAPEEFVPTKGPSS